LKGDITIANGTVKWFSANRGFGFIQQESGARDVFIHAAALESAGISRLDEGQKVTFDVEAGRDGRESACNLALA
jgi:CspA family cold shock protein